ncbi:Beta-galactosidase [Pseudobythopirellula maris]|uniref:Beta-galactosidase n=1 Tax=Pseudobythopirellula maris TaxID=2527991 RepID=A0A5C5ZUW8_9BACT|nr:glycoside hydrolase family 2 TIM barrel-domain containing protein [Pseudobythopirellula maris]TWT91030.1 Beta-galactosidase [Pseudobythopirellula maris]
MPNVFRPAIYALPFALLLCGAALAADRSLLDDAWRFHHGDAAGAEATGYDDAAWRAVVLPHDWSIEHAPRADAPSGGGGGYFPTGIGWYRRSLEKPSGEQRCWVHFEGVSERCEVWLNGESLGGHDYAYTPFRLDVTDKLREDKNALAVRVDNTPQPSSRWYTGSGLCRHVWLETAGPIHITHDSAWVETRAVGEDAATVAVHASVANTSGADALITVEATLLSPDGDPVAAHTESHSVPANGGIDATFPIELKTPWLWSPDSPRLYTARLRVLQGDEATDEQSVRFGVRGVEASAAGGLRLNGQPVELLGGNVHHDNGVLGAAAFGAAERRKARLLKEAGFNAVRTAHNPPAVAFLDACDELGLLVIDEALDAWRKPKVKHDYGERFDAHWRRDLTAMVLRDRRHPSVIMWSLGNEMYERGDESAPATARAMRELVRTHDTTRPVTAGVNGLGDDAKWPRLDALFAELDLVGYNYEEDRYAPDHARLPERVVYASETYQADVVAGWRACQEHAHVIGDFVWSGIDYLGEAGIGRVFPPGKEARPHWVGEHFPWHGAACGDIDITGRRKPISHFRNIVWDRGERLHAAVVVPSDGGPWGVTPWAVEPTRAHWNWPDHAGEPLTVCVWSRWPTVRLELNGRVVGEKPGGEAHGFEARLEVPYEPGELVAIGLDATGAEAERFVLRTAGKPQSLRMHADNASPQAGRQQIVYVELRLVDEQGQLCPRDERAVEFGVEGPAAIIAAGNADLTSLIPYTAPRALLDQGHALVVLRSTGAPGKAVLTARAEGLGDSSISIHFVNSPQTPPQ